MGELPPFLGHEKWGQFSMDIGGVPSFIRQNAVQQREARCYSWGFWASNVSWTAIASASSAWM